MLPWSRDVDVHQLNTLSMVARLGSITRAAEQLHLSQPAVSGHIKALEDELGLTLFERTARGMVLTVAGQRLRVRAEAVLAAHAEVLAEAARLRGGISGSLRLGIGANSDTVAAGRLVATLSQSHPDLEVTVVERDSAEVVDALLGGALDAGFFNTSGAGQPGLHTVQIDEFGLCLVAPMTFAPAETLDWAALAQQPWLCPPPGSCCGQAVRALMETHRVRPDRIIAVDRERSTRTLVAAGTGVGVLHAYTAEAAAAQGELQILGPVEHRLTTLLGVANARRDEPMLVAVCDAAVSVR